MNVIIRIVNCSGGVMASWTTPVEHLATTLFEILEVSTPAELYELEMKVEIQFIP